VQDFTYSLISKVYTGIPVIYTFVSHGILKYPCTIITGMPKSTLQLGKKMTFVAKYSPQGNKVIIIVPKQHHNDIKKMKNPLKIIAEEIVE
jgi:hypothetical protein